MAAVAAEDALGLELPPLAPEEGIKEGGYIILEQQNDKASMLVVKRDATARVGKLFVSLEPLIGAPYGAEFEVRAAAANQSYSAW